MHRDPDPYWLAELRRIDPSLNLTWDAERMCFLVTRNQTGLECEIFACERDGEPVEPGEWVVRYLRSIDTWQMHGRLRGFLAAMEARATKRRQRREASMRDDKRHAAREWAPYVQGEFFDGGTHHHSFSLIGAGEGE